MRKGLIWTIAILVVLGGGAWLGYSFFLGKKKEITHYSIQKIAITESSIAQGQVTYDGYAVLNTALPEWVTPEKVTVTSIWDKRLKVKTTVKKPKRTDARVDTLFFAMSNDLSDFIDELKRQQKKDSSLVQGIITIKGDIPMQDDDKPIVLKYSQKVRHFKFPSILMDKPEIKLSGIHRAKVLVGIQIKNLDRYYLSLRDIYAKIRLGQDAEAYLKNEPNMIIKPFETKHYNLTLDVDIEKPGKIVSKIISNKDTYIAEEYVKLTVGIGKTNTEKFDVKDNSVWQEFPLVMNQKDTLELLPKKGHDRFAPDKKKKD